MAADKKSNPAQISQAVLDESNQSIKVSVVSGGSSGVASDTNLKDVGGNTVATGAGAANTGTQRVVIASDQSTLPVDIQDTEIAVSLDHTEDSVTIYTPNNNTTAIPVSASGTVSVDNFPATQAVTGPLTNSELRASAVTTSVDNFSEISGLSIPAHDYIALSYTGGNLTGVEYRTGGATGTIVGTLTLAYSGTDLISVTKS